MKTNQRLFLDIHAIQAVPPSNLNRDDTGSPKTAQYGGVRRSRVSSQSWKRAIRKYFNENGAQSNVGVRTLDIVRYVADKIQKMNATISEEEALIKAEKVINDANIKTKDQKARALFFLGDNQAEKLAEAALNNVSDKASLQEILRDNPSIDIALFGRMVADDPSLNEDASCQIAHSISTHAVDTEFDFFTAVDDLAPEDNAGAGMLGTIEFNSSTLYRYGNIAIHELLRQLGSKEAAIQAIKLFIESFSNSLPTGKSNTFANNTLPSFVMVSLRSDRPVNLVTAFEDPVKAKNGFKEKSVDKLTEEFVKVQKFVDEPVSTWYVSMEGKSYDISGEEVDSLKAMLEGCSKDLEHLLY